VGYNEVILDGGSTNITWDQINWNEILNNRSQENNVEQLYLEYAIKNTGDCNNTTGYSSFTLVNNTDITTLSTNTDTSPLYEDLYINNKQFIFPNNVSDNQCLKIRFYIQTGDEAYTPILNDFTIDCIEPTLLDQQIDNAEITLPGDLLERNRKLLKIETNNTNFDSPNSEAYLEYFSNSNQSIFTIAEFELEEIQNNVTQYHDINVYFNQERLVGNTEQIDMSINIDVNGNEGATILREFTINVLSP